MDIKTDDTLQGNFNDVNARQSDRYLRTKSNINLLFSQLERYKVAADRQTPEALEHIEGAYRLFLTACEFHSTTPDFDEALKESRVRDNGDIGWHHQFTQILIILDMVRQNDLPLDQLKKYGGLEVMMRVLWRHDSIEDGFVKSVEQFTQNQKMQTDALREELSSHGYDINNEEWLQRQEFLNKRTSHDVMCMTKKIPELDENGDLQYIGEKIKKKNLYKKTIDYIHAMVPLELFISNPNALISPIPFLAKGTDRSHNLSNMLRAEKFHAKKRLSYSNESEDMYGGRQALPEKAKLIWPEFTKAIDKIDALMGSILFGNFAYLEHVDQEDAYLLSRDKFQDGDVTHISGIVKNLPAMMTINLPRAFHPFCNMIDDMQIIENNPQTSERRKNRINNLIENSFKPAFRLMNYPIENIFDVVTNHNLKSPANDDAKPALRA